MEDSIYIYICSWTIFVDKSHGNSLLKKKQNKGKIKGTEVGGVAQVKGEQSYLPSILHGPQQGTTATSGALTEI